MNVEFCEHSSTFIFDWILYIHACNKDNYKRLYGFEIRQDITGFTELAALEVLKKSPYTYNGRNVVTNLVLSFLDESSLFLQVTRASIKAWMSLNVCQIPLPTTEWAALERLNFCQVSSLTVEWSALQHLKNIVSPGFLRIFVQIFLILADNQNWHYILSVWIYSWSPFQVQSYLPLSILNYDVSNYYTLYRLPGERSLPIGLQYTVWLSFKKYDT